MEKGTREEQVLEALNDAGVVFVARLRTSTLSPDKEYPDMIHEDAQFVVIEVLKGPLILGQPILVQQNVSGGTCGRSSRNDPVWVEDLVKPETEHEEGIMEPTVSLDLEGEADLKILREFVKHPPKCPLAPGTHDRD